MEVNEKQTFVNGARYCNNLTRFSQIDKNSANFIIYARG